MGACAMIVQGTSFMDLIDRGRSAKAAFEELYNETRRHSALCARVAASREALNVPDEYELDSVERDATSGDLVAVFYRRELLRVPLSRELVEGL